YLQIGFLVALYESNDRTWRSCAQAKSEQQTRSVRHEIAKPIRLHRSKLALLLGGVTPISVHCSLSNRRCRIKTAQVKPSGRMGASPFIKHAWRRRRCSRPSSKAAIRQPRNGRRNDGS